MSDIKELEQGALAKVAAASSIAALEEVRVGALGKKLASSGADEDAREKCRLKRGRPPALN
ncbi:MAG: hypothetical protein R3C60_07525 [Parvularculaceae bacterium]